MRNFTFVYLFILMLSPAVIFGQAPQNIKKLEEKYTEYFKLDREAVFLHLNKTTVLPKENLWISAYVYNPKLHLPNKETANLNIDIFSEDGKFLDSKTILVSGGKGSLYFDLDPNTFGPGTYYLRASTNYMRNFEEDLSYLQSFTIYAEGEPQERAKESFDLQLLPEGGHLVTGVLSSVGVKLINHRGRGTSFTEAKVLNSAGVEITSFDSNDFGMARFNLTPRENEAYTVILTTKNGEKISKKVPTAQSSGIALTSYERKDFYIFSLKTNEVTRESLDNQKFFLAIHKDGAIKDVAFQFPENKLEANIRVEKDSLFTGVNTITVFNEALEPVLERLIFNSRDLKHLPVAAKNTARRGDSLSVELTASRPLNNNSMSISVLPAKTLAYNANHSIVSAFYLKPYIEGSIDHATYYFSPGEDQRKMYDLDLLLLTQGWSKYNWNKIFSKPAQEIYGSETGFSIEGKITGRNAKKHTSLFVRSEDSGLLEFVEINEDDTFRVDNLYIEDSTALAIGLVNERNDKITKPGVSFRISPGKTRQQPLAASKMPKTFPVEEAYTNRDRIDLISSDVSLDTISLIGIKKDGQKFRNESNTFQEEVAITDDIASRYFYVTDLIAKKGFRVIRTPTSVEIINNIPFSLNGNQSPLIIFNGAPMVNGAEMLIDLQTSQVESIVINKRGEGYGMQGGNGVIKVVTKRGAGTTQFSDTMLSVITDNGFSKDREFYTPRYSSYTSQAYEEFGTIDWISNLSLDAEGKAQFKILNTLQPEVKLIIQGINSEGYLISEELMVKTM